MSTPIYEEIITKLDEAGVKYETQHHEPTLTSEIASQVRSVPLEEGAKAIVVRGSKSREHFLFVMPANLRLDSKLVKSILGEKVSFAKDPEEVTGCVPGSVPPLGSTVGLKTHVDSRLSKNEMIHFNAGSLTDSVSMRYEDYLKVEEPMVIDCAKE